MDKVFVLDVDGTLTDGKMYYTEKGKVAKAFGCDDWDALKEISKFVDLVFITADTKGFPIVKKRIVDEMGWRLEIVSHKPDLRWDWIKREFPNKEIIFMGDGVYDYSCIQNALVGITTKDALEHVKEVADHVSPRSGGDRAAAEACIYLMKRFNWPGFKYKC